MNIPNKPLTQKRTNIDKQYVYNREDVITLIESIIEKHGNTGLQWGTVSGTELLNIIETLFEKYGSPIQAPRLANTIKDLETAKMVGGANSHLDKVIRGLKPLRIVKITRQPSSQD